MRLLLNNQEGRAINMKNYLFAPFKDDDDKIEEFNAVIRGLNYEVSDVNPSLTDAEVNHYHESALHGLRVFIGRFESYYDVIISDLKGENAEGIADERIIKELKAENDRAREYIAQVEKENDSLKYEHTMFHAREWFNNNPKCDKVYVFVLDADGVNDDGWIADSHAVASVNDGNCVGSYVRNANE